MSLHRFVVTLDAPDAPVVTIDDYRIPPGVVQSVQIEQATPHDLPQVILFMTGGEVTVNGAAVMSVEGTDAPDTLSFLASIDPGALSEAAAALQGRADPRNPARYLDNPTEAYLAALHVMAGG